MSKLDLVQLGSLLFHPQALFTSFQTLGNTTVLPTYPTNMAIPAAVAGSGSANPVGLFDNRNTRATTLLLALFVTATNAAKVAFDVTGFSKISGAALYTRTKFFLGEAQAGNLDVSTALGEATAFACDHFSLKTFAADGVGYIEPADALSMALLRVDIRGHDYAMVRFAQGAATAATKVQCYVGVN